MTTKSRKKVKFLAEYHGGYGNGETIDAYIYKKGAFNKAILLVPAKGLGYCDCLVIAEDQGEGLWKRSRLDFMNL